jgi:hypothetical protein
MTIFVEVIGKTVTKSGMSSLEKEACSPLGRINLSSKTLRKGEE